MKKLEQKIKNLEKAIKIIEERNKKVEADKSWETSNYRKISIAVITYIFMIITMYLLGMKNVFINALIPTFGYLLSTIGVNVMKKIYIKKLK